jgi:2-amino-4-hydroxy-6-hydroxymethyldihydropteridine diphosphokinase
MTTNNIAYLLTGTNMGNREDNLNQAKALIEKHIGSVKETSRLYETQAWGKTNQPNFFNQALAVETPQYPQEVLKNILKIEALMGRVRTEKWEERVIDIDILLFNEDIVDEDNLRIPHPHLHERNFALVPLMDVAGEVMHPIINLPIEEVYFECLDTLDVFMVEEEE